MYDKTEHKIKVVQSKDPRRFESDYNHVATELADYDVDVKTGVQAGYFYALFTYAVHKQAPESVSDEFTLAGIRHTCAECPYLEIGTDNRRKYWPCKYSEYGSVSKDQPACELLLKRLMQGAVRLRNAEVQYDD